jgi:allophanate hydrolase subunit 2
MIRFVKTPVATSVQDRGRVGHRSTGHARSGAMDRASLDAANAAAGAPPGGAAIEMGPGACVVDVTRDGVIAFGGAQRDGAPWWQPVHVAEGDRIELSPPRDGVWSYLAVGGGVDAPVVLGSRATCVREGVGAWLTNGDVVTHDGAATPIAPTGVEPIPMRGPIRIFGALPGSWRVGTRADRMGYALDGEPLRSGTADEWSEPLLPGFVQVPPGGTPIALMVEGPTVGGYRVAAIVHSDDLRLLAQAKPGTELTFIPA